MRRERVGRDRDRAGRAVQDLHGAVALEDVLKPPAMARADDEQVGPLGLGDMTQGAGRREIGMDLDDGLRGELVADRPERVLELRALLGIGARERQRRVVMDAHQHQPGTGGRRDGVRERDRPAATLVAVASGDDGPVHPLLLGRIDGVRSPP